jgi:branched-chain amino acid transport system substrate-binding protein
MTATGRLIALLATLGLVVSACGQKPGVSDQAAPAGALGAGQVAIDPETGQLIDPETGEVISSGDLGSTGLTGAGPATTGSGDQVAGTKISGGGGGLSSSGGEPQGGDTTGVLDKEIKIGFHAPLTGAAPVPSDSVQKGKDLYMKWLKDHGKSINGRDVTTILKDDQYNPSHAVAVCKEMVEKDKVFLLAGAAGADQIYACARYAASVAVPYVSAGVTESGLADLPGYFAITMTYPDQSPLLADYLVSKLGAKGEKNGILTYNTPSFEDAAKSFKSSMSQRGAAVAYDRRVSKYAGYQEAQTVINEMRSKGIENVYLLVAPVWWIQVLKAANSQGYHPQWIGPGISQTFDTVASAACPDGNAMNGAKFFAPFPAWIDISKYDPDFKAAVNKFNPEENGGDDFMVLSWGFSKVFFALLSLPGRSLTRERFVYLGERARNLKTGVFPPVSFTPDDPFGSSQVHVNEARCSDRRWHTIQAFTNDF